MKFFPASIVLVASSYLATPSKASDTGSLRGKEHEELDSTRILANISGGGARLKRDITFTISTSKPTFAADENVLIDLTIKNNEPNRPARVLDWVVPCDTENVTSVETPTEMSFFAIETPGGRVAKYLGAVFKRIRPDEKDYRVLSPGDVVKCTIDLGKYYQFDSTGDDKIYEIKYSVTSMELSNPNPSNRASPLESLESNTLTLKIDARDVPTRARLRERHLQAQNNFRSCDATQQGLLLQARPLAVNAMNDALGVIDKVSANNTLICPRYGDWFGGYDSNRHIELRDGYATSRVQMESASITFDCGCKKKKYYAYVYPNWPYEIFLCRAFWIAPLTGTDSKMGTLIHEMTHFSVTAGTDDFAYGQTNCLYLATTSPEKSINNADSHEYIAENTPIRSCQG